MGRLEKHLPNYIININEFSNIDETVSIELNELDSKILTLENNQYVHTANNRGVERYEKMFGLTPVGDIDNRRMNILNLYNTNTHYTIRWLRQYLNTLVGEGEYLILLNDLSLIVSITMSNAHLKQQLQKDLREKLPANVDVVVNLLATNNMSVYTGFINRSADKLKY